MYVGTTQGAKFSQCRKINGLIVLKIWSICYTQIKYTTVRTFEYNLYNKLGGVKYVK